MSSAPPARRGTRGAVIGKIGGAPIVIAPSWLIAALIITVMFAPTLTYFAPDLGTGAYLVAFAFAVLLFASVLAHEISHALTARARGASLREIVITVWGGHTTYASRDDSPGSAILIAVVGPITNAVLGGAFWLAYVALPSSTSPIVTWLVLSGAYANAFVAAFNLIPGLPLDGGQILQAVVWGATRDRVKGTVVAGWAGRVLAVAVVVLALGWPLTQGRQPSMLTGLWAFLIAAYLWMGASGAIRGARHNQRLSELSLDGIVHPAYPVAATATLHDLDQAAFSHGDGFPVLVAHTGQPVGYVQHAAAAAVAPSMRGATPLSAVSVPLPPEAWVRATLRGLDLAHAIGSASERSPAIVAVDEQGQVYGLVMVKDVIDRLRLGQ